MSQENVEIVRRVFDAINARDVDSALAEVARDVVVDFSASFSPYRGVYEGRPAVGRFWREFIDTWESLTWEAEHVVEIPPNRVALVNHIRGVGRHSGLEVDARGGQLWEIAGGKARRMTLFQSGADARRAAGLE